MAYYAYYAVCEWCGRDLGMLEQEGGRQRRYCSNACRQAAYRERRRKGKRNREVLRNAHLVEGWRKAGLGPVLPRLERMMREYGPQAAEEAAGIALDVAKVVREALGR